MLATRLTQRWYYPIAIWLMLLIVIFATEYLVMMLLPRLLPQHASRIFESAVDAVALTVVLAPVLWGTLVRPLREVIRLRTQFLADLFTQIENDRKRTASELHDGVGQVLTLLISGLRSAGVCRANEVCAGRVSGFQQLAENALNEVRRLALGLRPSLLDDLGLVPALERLVEDVRAHHVLALTLDADEAIGRLWPDAVATTVFRIAQEALTNIVKHAQARKASLKLRCAAGNLTLEVSDDGCGIPPAVLRTPPPGHLGLRGIHERAALLGGNVAIATALGQGTRLTVTIPAEGAAHGESTALARGRS